MKKETILLVFVFVSICPLCLNRSLAENENSQTTFHAGKNSSGTYELQITYGNLKIQSPEEGLWSIAVDWTDDQPTGWIHVKPDALSEVGDWTVLSGKTELDGGTMIFRDSYRTEKGMVKCVRRFEYTGEKPLERATLSVRWIVPGELQQAFLPGTVYYGNPSGEKNTPNNVPVYHGRAGEFAVFEEHRFPMPFAALEKNDGKGAAAIHTIPSRVLRGKNQDQWWSMGVKAFEKHSELTLLSGPIGYNGKHNIAKAIQGGWLEYPEATMTILPGTVIEKTFYLDCWPIEARGRCFQRPVEKSIELFQPFFAGDFPEFEAIVKGKYRFAKSRWIEGGEGDKRYAGFNMYPAAHASRIVMGWCGQAAAPVSRYKNSCRCSRKTTKTRTGSYR